MHWGRWFYGLLTYAIGYGAGTFYGAPKPEAMLVGIVCLLLRFYAEAKR